MQRRGFIKLLGGGVVVAASGAGLFAATRTPAKALAPWDMAGDDVYDDPRLHALSYAILAPNPHNRQPWTVALEGTDALTLHFDTARQLPHTDPFDRQLTIGMGCFLELLRMAANRIGFAVNMDLFPEGYDAADLDDRPVARVVFQRDTISNDPLWAHVLHRRSNKEPYDVSREVHPSLLAQITATAQHTQVGGSVDREDLAFWRDLSEKALRIELETPHTYKESVDLFRIGKAEINANPDGIDFGGPLFDSLSLVGQFSRDAALDRESIVYKSGLDAVIENCRTAMGHIWMVTPGNSRLDQINAGADWLRINLAATAAGLGFQPLSQALQEYPEMSDIYEETHTKIAGTGGTVQMLARIGYGPTIAASPRWPIEAKLVPA